MGPMIVMNWRMKPICHRLGLWSRAGSTLSPGTAIWDVSVEYQKVPVGTGEFLLPLRSAMRMVMTDATETRTTAVYSGCREYHGEATIRFDDAAVAGEVQAAASPTVPLPGSLSLSLALTSPIDTDTAAAGDIVTARLGKPVHMAKEVLVPAGATVEGRIVQMQHWLEKPRHFTISLFPRSE